MTSSNLARRRSTLGRLGIGVWALIFLLAWPYLAHAEAKSTWRGLIVQHPESISGNWEAKEGSSVIGLEIHLTTEVGGRPLTLRGVSQTFLAADIEIYERQTPQQRIGDGNWFRDNSPGVEWNGWHLRIRPARADQKPIAVDLILNPASGTWTGRYHRGSVDHDVVLTRPSREREDAPSPFVGTWISSTLMNNCLHIAQAENGALVGWSDDLITPGKIRWANGIQPPSKTPEQFGSIALITTSSARSLVIELKALSAGCCSIISGGQLTEDSRTLRLNGRAAWTRIRGYSCIE
jgi:hypothetical protein